VIQWLLSSGMAMALPREELFFPAPGEESGNDIVLTHLFAVWQLDRKNFSRLK